MTFLGSGRTSLMSYQGTRKLASGKEEYVEYVYARPRGTTPRNGWKKNVAVGLRFVVFNGSLSWGFGAITTAPDMGGVVMDDSVAGNEPARIQIYGKAEKVVLTSAVTTTSTKKSIVRGAISLTNASGAWATITDGKTTSLSTRDVFVLGKDFIGHTLFRHMGQVRDSRYPLSSSLLVDGYGRYFMNAIVTGVITSDNTIIRLRMSDTGDGPRWVQGVTVADDIFIYAAVPLAKKTGSELIKVQVAGLVEQAVIPTVTTTSAKPGILHDSAANATVEAGLPYAVKAFAIDSAATAGTKHDLHLLGRIFTG